MKPRDGKTWHAWQWPPLDAWKPALMEAIDSFCVECAEVDRDIETILQQIAP